MNRVGDEPLRFSSPPFEEEREGHHQKHKILDIALPNELLRTHSSSSSGTVGWPTEVLSQNDSSYYRERASD